MHVSVVADNLVDGVLFCGDVDELLHDLEGRMREGRGGGFHERTEPEFWSRYMRGLASMVSLPSKEIARRPSLPGPRARSGGGYSLIFNSHLDTTLRPDAVWSARDPGDPLYHSAWVEGDEIFGDGVVNDKGPMAAFLVAAKAIRDSGYPLAGDLIVSAVAGEISREPVDEFVGPSYLSKDLGARFMVTHGAVADFALVAEGTGFGIVGVEPGKAHFKVTVFTDQPRYYTPYLPRPTSLEDAPNAIVRTGAVIAAFERWAYELCEKPAVDRSLR